MDGFADAFRKAGVAATVTGFPQIFHVGFGLERAPVNYRDTIAIDRQGYVRLATALLQRGVRALERGAWFLSTRSEEHTSELPSLMRISYAVFCLKKKTHNKK